MTKFVFSIVALLVLTVAPTKAKATSVAPAYIHYCQAQSWATGRWYYWRSFNVWQARNNALAACVLQNGYTCNVACW